ncbi:MAG: helix-hairpin-helix domain-containing protein [Turicibacter sp.]|nr:helix-hairpin-helix domain-containing protein [Turicibacter sp.]
MKRQLKIIGIAALVMGCIYYFSQWKTVEESVLLEEYLEQERVEPDDVVVEELQEQVYYLVDVKGQVNQPGVYEVESTLRIHEVIELAGGFLETANVEAINLAQKIKDEMVIYVPHLDEVTPISFQESWMETKESSSKVSLNAATEDELQTLPGIGPSKAAAIVKYREEIGLFQSIEELVNVSGIGVKTLENLRESIEL